MGRTEILKILTQYSTLYRDYELTPLSAQAWYSLFEQEDPSLFLKAFQEACRGNKYGFPNPGDVQEIITRIKAPLRWSPEKAWEKALAVVDYCRRKGHLAEEARAKFNEGNQNPFWLTMNNKNLYQRIYDIFVAPKTTWGRSYSSAEEGYLKRDWISEYKNNLENNSVFELKSRTLTAPERELIGDLTTFRLECDLDGDF